MKRHASLCLVVTVCALTVGCAGARRRPYLPARLPWQPELAVLAAQPQPLAAHKDAETAAELTVAVTAACASIEPGGDVTVDAPAKFQRWRPEGWASPAAVSLEQTDAGLAYISADCRKGDKDKWVITLSQDMDLSKFRSLSLHVRSDKPVKLALGVWTGDPGKEHMLFESRPIMLSPSGWRRATLHLKEPGLKAAATEWKHTVALGNPGNTRAISLLIYGAEPCKVEFCGVNVSSSFVR